METNRAYSSPLLGVIIAPNLVLWILEKMFSLETIKNDICLGGARKQYVFFPEHVPW